MRITGVFLTLALLTYSEKTIAQRPPSLSSGVYSNAALGFRYQLPGGMNDETELRKEEMHAGATEHHTSDTLDLLLGMTSAEGNSTQTWRSFAIEIYPRQRLSSLDDVSAEARMSAWVMGIGGSPGVPRTVVLAGQSFAVSVFTEQEGKVTKGAVVWTTVRKGMLLSFVFVANAPEQLKRLTESMKSVQFF
ncbi:MAG: hypothetical protein WCA13_19010 [Terriglobales bacterium]